jgi:hypothetical protein
LKSEFGKSEEEKRNEIEIRKRINTPRRCPRDPGEERFLLRTG